MKVMAEAKDQFVATVSHDFRSPLAIILSTIQTLASDPQMPAEVRHTFLARAERQCRRLGALVNDLLDLARIENRETVFERVSLALLLEDSVEAQRPAFDERGVELRLDLPPADVHAVLDRSHVGRAVTNLLDNARKFTPAAGRVTVTLGQDGGMASIVVADTGPGIPEEERTQVFERFFQGKHGQALGSGSGLGLAIVAGVARRHRGHVEVSSDGGSGSRFELRLPLERAPTEPTGGPEPLAPGERAAHEIARTG
jgi:two-component system phosphate regulon sensor histidine kinase PhoR